MERKLNRFQTEQTIRLKTSLRGHNQNRSESLDKTQSSMYSNYAATIVRLAPKCAIILSSSIACITHSLWNVSDWLLKWGLDKISKLIWVLVIIDTNNLSEGISCCCGNLERLLTLEGVCPWWRPSLHFGDNGANLVPHIFPALLYIELVYRFYRSAGIICSRSMILWGCRCWGGQLRTQQQQ